LGGTRLSNEKLEVSFGVASSSSNFRAFEEDGVFEPSDKCEVEGWSGSALRFLVSKVKECGTLLPLEGTSGSVEIDEEDTDRDWASAFGSGGGLGRRTGGKSASCWDFEGSEYNA
jgi:hypothetical protein